MIADTPDHAPDDAPDHALGDPSGHRPAEPLDPSHREANGASSDDERFFVMKGRRWRRTDPDIPEDLNQQLTKELMSARRAVKAAKASGVETDLRAARARVQDAKVALGERGQPWWEEPSYPELGKRLGATIRCLLRRRGDGKTICPSEAARVVGGAEWRPLMARTREVAWQLERDGVLIVTQRGDRVERSARGPIRLQGAAGLG